MDSEMYRLLLVTLLAFVLVDTSAACQKSATTRVMEEGIQAKVQWYCSPEEVLFEYEGVHRCYKKHAKCPNAIHHEDKCHCFPGTSRDSKGSCGQICKDCKNGWCSSKSTCECNEGFILSQGRCESCQADYIFDPKTRACIPYESANAPDMNVRAEN